MANVSIHAAKKPSWFEERLIGFHKLFAEDPDPIKDLMKTAVKIDPIYCLPSSETVGDLFTIGKKLGEGGFGAVYSAVRNTDKKLVALKYMKTNGIIYWWDKKDEDEGTPMEIYVYNKLKNIPGVVALLDVYMTNGGEGYMLVMDQPPPPVKDLYDYARNKFFKINEMQARNIVVQVISIIRQVHHAGVYHQDVKLENLLIQPKTGKVHLIDFGAAQLVEQEPYYKFYGTAVYQPVEMLTNRSCRAEPSTVWSIGILAFKLVAGHYPFNDDKEILEGNLHFTERCTTDMCNFVSACLCKDPSARPTLSQLSEHTWLNQGLMRPTTAPTPHSVFSNLN